jgi:hypothetical protein
MYLIENYKTMLIILENEKTGHLFKKTLIGRTPQWFYDIDDYGDIFFEELEQKYNCTLDFTGGNDFIKWSIYEIEDESKFPIILDDIFKFLKDPNIWISTRKYNL